MSRSRGFPNHTTFQAGGMVDSFDDLLCNRCGEKATHSFGDDFDLCDDCTGDLRRWFNRV